MLCSSKKKQKLNRRSSRKNGEIISELKTNATTTVQQAAVVHLLTVQLKQHIDLGLHNLPLKVFGLESLNRGIDVLIEILSLGGLGEFLIEW